MPQFSTTRRVKHSAADMFDLVADVEHYPQFVPLCRSLAVRKRTTDGEGRDVIVADMTVAYKLVRETFTSRVTLDRPKLEILVEYLEGPFERMNNRWSFRATGEGSLRCGIFHRLRVPQPHPWPAHGRHFRRRLSAFRHGLRAPRRSGLWRSGLSLFRKPAKAL